MRRIAGAPTQLFFDFWGTIYSESLMEVGALVIEQSSVDGQLSGTLESDLSRCKGAKKTVSFARK